MALRQSTSWTFIFESPRDLHGTGSNWVLKTMNLRVVHDFISVIDMKTLAKKCPIRFSRMWWGVLMNIMNTWFFSWKERIPFHSQRFVSAPCPCFQRHWTPIQVDRSVGSVGSVRIPKHNEWSNMDQLGFGVSCISSIIKCLLIL